MAFTLVLMQQFNDCLHPVIRSHAVLSFAAVETVILVEVMELVQLLCHLQCDPVVFHIPLHRAPALILRTDTGNELIVPALHKSILAHPGNHLRKSLRICIWSYKSLAQITEGAISKSIKTRSLHRPP